MQTTRIYLLEHLSRHTVALTRGGQRESARACLF
jgi:hypothetical protein